MRFSKLLVILLVTSSTLVGCLQDDSVDRVKTVEMTIYPEIGYGGPVMSDILSEVMIFSETDDREKKLFTDIITENFDFDYQIGHQYTFKAQKIWMSNPPQDVSSVKYKKVGPVEVKKIVTNDFTESIVIKISSSKVQFVPRFTELSSTATAQPVMALEGRDSTTYKRWVMKQIEGFDYQEGYTYTVKLDRKVKANPYQERFVLVEVLSKEKAN